MPEQGVEVSNQQVDFMAAKGLRGTDVYLMLLNNSTREQTTVVGFSEAGYAPEGKIYNEQGAEMGGMTLKKGTTTLTLPPLSLRVLKLSQTTNRH